MANKPKTTDYEVGHSRPPKHSQFQPGTSGNPRGRPKGSVSLKTAVKRVAGETLWITENGVRKRITKVEALVKQQVNKAIGGCPRAGALVVGLFHLLEDPAVGDPGQDLQLDSAEVAAILARIRGDGSTEGQGGGV